MIEVYQLGMLPAAYDHLSEWESAMSTFRVIDKDGNQVTSYPHFSQAVTYWRNSCPGCEFDTGKNGSKGPVTVFDGDSNEVGQITFPEDAKESVAAFIKEHPDRTAFRTPSKVAGKKTRGSGV